MPNAVLPVKPLGKTGKPLGQLALPAYRRAAELDPSDPWTWIAITWMGTPADWDAALDRAVAAAETANDDRARAAALQLPGGFVRQRGRAASRSRAFYVEALRIAGRNADANHPIAAADESGVALGPTVLGGFFAQQGQHEKPGRYTTRRSSFEAPRRL